MSTKFSNAGKFSDDWLNMEDTLANLNRQSFYQKMQDDLYRDSDFSMIWGNTKTDHPVKKDNKSPMPATTVNITPTFSETLAKRTLMGVEQIRDAVEASEVDIHAATFALKVLVEAVSPVLDRDTASLISSTLKAFRDLSNEIKAQDEITAASMRRVTPIEKMADDW